MEHKLESTIALLERTPAALEGLLRGLPAEWTHCDEGEGTMSPFLVVGHLIYADRLDWIPRARMILQFGEERAFEPFDRWRHLPACEGKSLGMLLDEFATVRAEALADLRGLASGSEGLTAEQLERRGRHPEFGAVKLSELLATWAVHDLTHIRQIVRVMAGQYREAVGPWREYLGILKP